VNTANKNLSAAGNDALESRFALRVAACLSESTQGVGPDVSERLRISRERALERARQVRVVQTAQSKSGLTAAGAAILGGGWWPKLGVALPLLLLLVGLLLIQQTHLDEQITTAAEIDAALLTDDVPPDAYSDPGFVEFLKTPRN
jgi:hypothetical protein